jgi:hypothetical protein
MSVSDLIADLFDRKPRYRGVQANESIVLAAATRPVTATSLHAAFERVRSQLCASADYLAAYRAFFDAHPEYALEGNMSILDDLHHGEEITAQTLLELLENPKVVAQLAVTAEYQRAAQDEQERAQLIADLVGAIKPSIDGYSGREVCMDVSSKHLTDYKSEVERIQNLSLEELRAYRDQKAERQRLQSLTPAQIRDEVNAGMKEAWAAKTATPELPQSWTAPNGEVVELNRRNIVKMPKDWLRILLNRYGPAAMDARLGVTRQQVGHSFKINL